MNVLLVIFIPRIGGLGITEAVALSTVVCTALVPGTFGDEKSPGPRMKGTGS